MAQGILNSLSDDLFYRGFQMAYSPSFQPQGGEIAMAQYLSHSAVLRGVRGAGESGNLRGDLRSDAAGGGVGVGLPGGVNPDSGTQGRLTSGSPVYGCFHTDNGGLRHLPNAPQQPPPPVMTGESVVPLHSTGPRPGLQSIDCCSEDTEEGSRQSGKVSPPNPFIIILANHSFIHSTPLFQLIDF